MGIRTRLKSWAITHNHNQTLLVRSALKAGKMSANHNEILRVRAAVKAGGISINHNEGLRRQFAGPSISMRQQLRATARRGDRLELMVVRAGLRAGLRRKSSVRH